MLSLQGPRRDGCAGEQGHHPSARLEALHAAVEQRCGQPFQEAFLDTVDVEKWNGASEYVLYYHHALQQHPERVVTRHLRTCDIIHDSEEPFDAPSAMRTLREAGRYDASVIEATPHTTR